ncbi:uncharacterized protein C1orf87 homolog isoform X2 [Elephas maximus indicus]|uniref:uncharacterized protein C1orf87 homolog isoform X2 n=1 Tax=Elephas maximus indicus TaxID=99487 RepID=UPI0021164E6F|nr:uncharacterized protein C1orf87 homolog isoform X2 [Elephas maximus indicus]
MSSVWKTPYGSDAMPETVVKIIGSKHFRYLVEKPKIKENENLNETQTALRKSVTGHAKQMSRESPASVKPAAQQVSCNPDDVEEIADPENNQKCILTEAHNSRFLDSKVNLHCSSVPTGDQSLSYIHGLPRRSLRVWSLEQMGRDSSDQPEDIIQWPSRTTREDTFLLSLVRRELKSCALSSSLLDKIQKELKILDPTSSGHLLQSQLSHLLLRHEVPLKLPTIKILCQRFSGRGSPEMVNYEKLLCFLKVAASNDPQPSRTVLDSDLRKTQSPTNQNQRWQNFVELLSRASSDMLCDLPAGKNEKEVAATPVEPEVPKMSQSKTEHMKTPEEEPQPESPPADTLAREDPLSSLKIRPVSQPFVDLDMKKDPEECEAWIDRFRKLENALYLCDLSNTGALEKERARRLIHNYNLIYNLSLSPRKIDQALRRFRSGENMLLEPALQYLKEL